jgi:signal transduction histidine kinase
MPSRRPAYKTERSSLAMVAASLLVIGVIAGLMFWQQGASHEQRLRAQGASLVRLLGKLSPAELAPAHGNGPLQILQHRDDASELAYVALVDASGATLHEAAAPGVFVPAAPLPETPSAWLGERRLADAPSGRAILEFHAPVFDGAELGGFVRLGYFADGQLLDAGQLSFLATLALLVFSLVPLFHLLLRREIRPLRRASGEIASLIEEGRLQPVEVRAAGELAEFVGHFNRAMELARQRVSALEHEHVELETSSKLLSYSKARVERVLDALPEAVLVVDDQGVVSFANGKIAGLLGATREQVLGKSPATWCEEPALLDLLNRCGGRGAPAPRDAIELTPHCCPDKVVAVAAYPLFAPRDAGTSLGTLIVLRDVTLEALARRSRGEFVAHLAHELKTPLNVLGMYSEALQGEEADDPQFRTDAVNVIRDEVERLAGLINNLLNITRIENGSLDLKRQRVKLGDLLRDAFDNVSRSGRGADLQFDLDVPRELGAVQVDKDLLRIAVNNLLTNAIKYNRPGGRVTLAAEEDSEVVRIRVRDTGIGINPEDRGRVFEKFFRSDDAQVRERTGHGLGLALVKDITDLHGGSLTVNSEPGVGSEFVIELWRESGALQRTA